MNQQHASTTIPPGDSTLLRFANVVLRERRSILLLGFIGGLLGGTLGLTSRRTFESRAIFLPQSSEESLSGLALAASQFGVEMPTAPGGGWGAGVYARLLQTPALLGSVHAEPVRVDEERRSATLAELLKVPLSRPERVDALTIEALRRVASVRENKTIGSVEVSVTTRWPSVSQEIAKRLVTSVHQFNLEKLQAKAAAERRFIESRAAVEEDTLRAAEGRLQSFLQQNRAVTNSPELMFRRERLEREVALHEALHTSLLKGLDEARIREVRNTPVITVVEEPQRPVLPKSRRTVLKAALGAFIGGLLALAFAILRHAVRRTREHGDAEAREFLDTLEQSLPASLRRLLG